MPSVTSTSSSSPSANRGLSGLVSGLDTEQMVKDLLIGAQNKIDKADQQKQQVQWKQTMYRDIISKLQTFQSSYFSFTNEKTNLMSNSFYNTMSAVSSSSSVTVSASTQAKSGTMTINSVSQLATRTSISGSSQTSGILQGELNMELLDNIAENDILTVTLDGIQKDIKLNASATTESEFVTSLEESLKQAFGSSIKVSLTGSSIEFTPMKVVGVATLEEDSSRQIIVGGSPSALNVLGLVPGQSNKIATGMGIGSVQFARELVGDSYDFAINGQEFSFNASSTLSEIISTINSSDAGVTVSYSTLEDRFVITANNYGAGIEISMEDGPDSNLLEVLFGSEGSRVHKTGQNAVLTINDTEIQRSGNVFAVDGVTISLKNVSNTPVNIEVSRNTQQIVDGITKFVDDYNSLVEDLNKLIREERHRDYQPLTDAQRAEMSDREIELWEEKSKQGLLRGDSTISGILSELRSAVYSRVESSHLAIYDLGIETSAIYTDNGKLVINDPSKIAAAVERDPLAVSNLFNDPDGGIATKFNSILNRASRVSHSSPGSLVSLAGANELTGKDSVLGRQLKTIEDRLDLLKTRYEKEKTQYWDQFNRLEQIISQMNQQSTWLMSQFSQ